MRIAVPEAVSRSQLASVVVDGDNDPSCLSPIETEPSGERYFQVEDANGIIAQLVQWATAPPEKATT